MLISTVGIQRGKKVNKNKLKRKNNTIYYTHLSVKKCVNYCILPSLFHIHNNTASLFVIYFILMFILNQLTSIVNNLLRHFLFIVILFYSSNIRIINNNID